MEMYLYTRNFGETNETTNVAPAVLTYVDLMNTGDARAIETAQRIFTDVLQNQF